METKNIKQWTVLSCNPKQAYAAWMDSAKHGKMIKANAKIEPKVGGAFSIWDGSMVGKTLELDPDNNRIVQSWRYDYDDWPKYHFSKITIEFTTHKGDQCKVLFWQSGIPAKYADGIARGWKEYYWEPMKEYFLNK